MNRIEFYNKLDKAKAKRDEELYHSEYGDYYNKLENYYGIGKARYFKTKAEWDAYQEGLSREKAKQKQLAEKAANKEAERGNDMSGFNDWKKQQDAEKAKKNQYKIYGFSGDKSDLEEMRNTYNKNRDAERATTGENRESAQRRSEDIIKEREDNASKERVNAKRKLISNELNSNKLYNDYKENKKEHQYDEEKRNAMYENLVKQGKLHNQKLSNYEKNKAAGEAEADREKEKLENQAKQDKIERTKYKGVKNLEKKIKQDALKKWHDEVEKNRAEAEEKKKKEEGLEKWRNDIAQAKLQKEYNEKQIKVGNSIEEQKRKEETERKERNAKLEQWKEDTKDKVNDISIDIYDNIRRCSKDRSVTFDVDNPYVDLFKERLKQEDPDFDGDIAAYVRPYPGHGILGLVGNDLALDEKHTNMAKKVLQDLESDIDKVIDDRTYNEVKYNDFLEELKATQEKNRVKGINDEMKNVRSSIESMYNGDSEKLEMDKSLKKVLENKIKELDPEYKRGNLYKYVRPYVLGKWIKDDDSYEIVMKALDELEKELRQANKNNGVYGEFINKVSKILD